MATLEDLKAWQTIVGVTPDGAPGPRTFDATVAWFRAHGHIAPTPTPLPFRERVVAEARAHVGAWSEADVDALWREVGVPEFVGHWHDKSWCGGYALRCLRRTLPVCATWTWRIGLGFLEVKGLPKVSLPEVGDIAYFAKNQHHAIVVGVGNGRVRLVNGNGMTAPVEGITENERPIADATTYYSIGRLG